MTTDTELDLALDRWERLTLGDAVDLPADFHHAKAIAAALRVYQDREAKLRALTDHPVQPDRNCGREWVSIHDIDAILDAPTTEEKP